MKINVFSVLWCMSYFLGTKMQTIIVRQTIDSALSGLRTFIKQYKFISLKLYKYIYNVHFLWLAQ